MTNGVKSTEGRHREIQSGLYYQVAKLMQVQRWILDSGRICKWESPGEARSMLSMTRREDGVGWGKRRFDLAQPRIPESWRSLGSVVKDTLSSDHADTRALDLGQVFLQFAVFWMTDCR